MRPHFFVTYTIEMSGISTFDGANAVNAISTFDQLDSAGKQELTNASAEATYNAGLEMAHHFVKKYVDVTQALGYVTELYRVNNYNSSLYTDQVTRMDDVKRNVKTNTHKTRMRYMLKRADAMYNELVTTIVKMALFLVSFAVLAYITVGSAFPTLAQVAVGACGVALITFTAIKFGSWFDRDRLNPSRIIIRAKKPE